MFSRGLSGFWVTILASFGLASRSFGDGIHFFLGFFVGKSKPSVASRENTEPKTCQGDLSWGFFSSERSGTSTKEQTL